MALEITDHQRRFLAEARQATMATMSAEGRPRLVPICFVAADGLDAYRRLRLYTPLDEKPKRDADPRRLARVRDLLILPEVTLLVDRWDEDWTKLAWLRAYGAGELLEPQPHEREEHTMAIEALREKYPQYRDHALEERPIIRIAVDRVVAWEATPGA
jgi:PPOX class probable F420-dependent enzyme